MTNREFFTAVLEANVSVECSEHAQKMLNDLDKRNKARSGKMNEKQVNNIPLMNALLTALHENGTPMTGSVLLQMHLHNGFTSVSKVCGLCGKMVKDGKLLKEKVKVKGKGEQVAYSLNPEKEFELYSIPEKSDNE